MAQHNPISYLTNKYENFIDSPLKQAAILSAIFIPTAYALKNPIYRMMRGYAMKRAGSPGQARKAYDDMNKWSNSWKAKWGLPILWGSIPAAVSLAANLDFHKPGAGLTQWQPQPIFDRQTLTKTSSFYNEYSPVSDFNTPVNPQYLVGLIKNNPLLQDNSYAINLGSSILNAAPSTGFNTTLGNVYDSALNKFDKKLSFQGLAGSAIKGVVSGSLAGMFTDVCGAMAGLPKSIMNPMSGDVGLITGVGTALKSILL